jgi:hypothetical protein
VPSNPSSTTSSHASIHIARHGAGLPSSTGTLLLTASVNVLNTPAFASVVAVHHDGCCEAVETFAGSCVSPPITNPTDPAE